jgi:hypothetical protein
MTYKINRKLKIVKIFLPKEACRRELKKPYYRAYDEPFSHKFMFLLKKFYINILGFLTDETMNKLLELEINSIRLSPSFEACKTNIQQAEVNLNKIDEFKKESEYYIYEYFEDIKRQVDLRRETLKVEIDDYSDDIINKVNQTQKKCNTLSKTVKLISAEIEKSRIDLKQLTKDFDNFVINDTKFEDISLKVNELKPKLTDLYDKYKDSLLDNKKYAFCFNPIKIEDIFGYFDINHGVI